MPEYVVSPDGREGAAGTAADPFATIQDGVDVLTPGDVLVVRGGSYPENVHIADKHGTSEAPIHIRCHPGETVFVDGFEPADITGKRAAFRTIGNDEWLLASDTDPQAHTDEYVSRCRFPSGESTGVRHGAFVDWEPYTRLITYSCLADLRAENQRFGRLPLDDETPPFPGHAVLWRDDDGNLVVDPVMHDGVVIAEAYKRPWTYLGPGLCQDPEGRIHIRLSHTANATPEIATTTGRPIRARCGWRSRSTHRRHCGSPAASSCRWTGCTCGSEATSPATAPAPSPPSGSPSDETDITRELPEPGQAPRSIPSMRA
jgi:hypothetical protein